MYIQCVVGWWFAQCCNDHNGMMSDSTISGPIYMFTVCYLRTQLMRCSGPFHACVEYCCVEGRLLLNTGELCGLSSDSLYWMFIGSGMSVLAGGPGFWVTGVEYFENFCVGGWVTWISASCTGAGCGRFFVFGTGRDDAAVSKILASFLSSERWSELAAVVNSGKGCLSVFTNSLTATNILVVGNNVGAATYVGKIVQ